MPLVSMLEPHTKQEAPWIARLTAACALCISLAGCAGGAGLSGSGLLGGGEPSTSVAALDARISPPLPERRPREGGKKPGQTAPMLAGGAVQTPAAAPREPALSRLLTHTAIPQTLLKPGKNAPAAFHADMKPVSAYTVIARLVKTCWLNFSKPRLKNHKFEGEASPEPGSGAKILIYEKAPDQKLGRAAFRIDLRPDAGGTFIETANYRLTPEESYDLQADIASWVRGAQSCTS